VTHAEKTMQEALQEIRRVAEYRKEIAFKVIQNIAEEALTYAWDDEKSRCTDD
jgi:thymidylate synthase ThyX